MADFAANKPGRQRIRVIAVERFDAAVANGHVQAATVGTIERTGTVENFELRIGHENHNLD